MKDSRQKQVEAGLSVVANIRKGVDTELIDWAKQNNKLVYIGRRTWQQKASKWMNPYTIPKHGDRAEVCDQYKQYLEQKPELLEALPELKGKVLACWCYPEQCHGDHLAERVNGGLDKNAFRESPPQRKSAVGNAMA